MREREKKIEYLLNVHFIYPTERMREREGWGTCRQSAGGQGGQADQHTGPHAGAECSQDPGPQSFIWNIREQFADS